MCGPPAPGGLIFKDFSEKKNKKCLENWSDTCTEKFPLVSLGAWAEGLACADLGARAPRGAI